MKILNTFSRRGKETNNISCLRDCRGECCGKGVRIRVHQRDIPNFQKLQEKGWELKLVDRWPDDNSGAGRYETLTDCPEKNRGVNGGCGIYGTDGRLLACRDFLAGGEGCQAIRTHRGY